MQGGNPRLTSKRNSLQYIDLLTRLSSSGVGCYVGGRHCYFGAYSYCYASLLAICDSYASEFDIIFNADKSKFLVVAPNKRRALYNLMCDCQFFIGGKPLENVKQYTHMGHILSVPLL